MKKPDFKIIAGSVLLCVVISCNVVPTTKDEYLKGFESFIDRVKSNYRDYSQNDWKWADGRFEKYASEWYSRFSKDLTELEKLKIAGWIVEYESFKGGSKLRDFYRKHIKNEVDSAGKEIKDYFRKDFEIDVSNAVEGAKEIGDSAIKVLGDIAKGLKKNKK